MLASPATALGPFTSALARCLTCRKTPASHRSIVVRLGHGQHSWRVVDHGDGHGSVNPGGNGSAGTLAVNGGLTENGGVNNQFVLSNVGGTNDLLTVNGNLTVNGLNTITLTAFGGGLISGGIYPLITYSGALTLSTGVLTNNFQVVAFGMSH